MTTANMRNATVAGNLNGAIHNQGGMQQTMNPSGMPFNTGKLTSMMNSGKTIHLFLCLGNHKTTTRMNEQMNKLVIMC